LTISALSIACGGGQQPVEDSQATAPKATGSTGVLERAAAAVNLPRYREVTVPAGTTLSLELKSAVGSDSSSIEDTVRAELRQAITVEGREVLPAGAEVVGHVTDVERSGRVKGRARVAYQFSSLSVGGDNYDIRTASISHLAPASKGDDAKKIAIGAGAGAALGALLGGGDGAAKGAAIGGAGGTGVVLATRGKEITLGPGADVSTRLTAPLTLKVRVS
jgi:hypothetical protein